MLGKGRRRENSWIKKWIFERLAGLLHYKNYSFAIEDFWSYFADALPKLDPLIADGLVQCSDIVIQVTPLGRLLVRLVCASFDRYLHQANSLSYSKVV